MVLNEERQGIHKQGNPGGNLLINAFGPQQQKASAGGGGAGGRGEDSLSSRGGNGGNAVLTRITGSDAWYGGGGGGSAAFPYHSSVGSGGDHPTITTSTPSILYVTDNQGSISYVGGEGHAVRVSRFNNSPVSGTEGHAVGSIGYYVDVYNDATNVSFNVEDTYLRASGLTVPNNSITFNSSQSNSPVQSTLQPYDNSYYNRRHKVDFTMGTPSYPSQATYVRSWSISLSGSADYYVGGPGAICPPTDGMRGSPGTFNTGGVVEEVQPLMNLQDLHQIIMLILVVLVVQVLLFFVIQMDLQLTYRQQLTTDLLLQFLERMNNI